MSRVILFLFVFTTVARENTLDRRTNCCFCDLEATWSAGDICLDKCG